jgi:hypothetical protein
MEGFDGDATNKICTLLAVFKKIEVPTLINKKI